MIRTLLLFDGCNVKSFDVEVRLCDGFLSFKTPHVYLEGVFTDYKMLRYRFVSKMMDRYCACNMFFTRKKLDNKKV